VSEQN
jgi:hypothetical protein